MLDALKSQIFLYILDAITLRELREWFAPYSISPESFGDPEFTRIAYEMMGDLLDLDEGQLTERTFKISLQGSYEPSFASSYVEIKLNFGDRFSSIIPQTGSLIREAIPV